MRRHDDNMWITRREFGAAVATSAVALLVPGELLADPTKPGKKPEPTHSTSGKQHEEHHEPANPIVHNWDRINAGQPMPSGGAGLQIRPNGDWQFTGHLYNSQVMPCQVGIMFAVLSSNGNLYTFQVVDVINGSFSGGNQLFQWDKHGESRPLKAEWLNIVKRHDWACESLMLMQTPTFGSVSSFNPQLLLANMEDRLNAVGPVVAVCR
jgi:hypothetical protein